MKSVIKRGIIFIIMIFVLELLLMNLASKFALGEVKNNNYNRKAAREYALKWAEGSNTSYYNYINEGGDCTNFVSQVLRAGGMEFWGSKKNATDIDSWFYYSQNIPNRTSTWTGANPFNQHFGKVHKRVYKYREYTVREAIDNFEEISRSIYEGDIVQYSRPNNIAFHSQAITDIMDTSKVLFSQHSNSAVNFYKNGNLKYYLLGKPDNYNLLIYNVKEEKGDSIYSPYEGYRSERNMEEHKDYKKDLEETIHMIRLSINDTSFDNEDYNSESTDRFINELKDIVDEIEVEMNSRGINSKELYEKLLDRRDNISN